MHIIVNIGHPASYSFDRRIFAGGNGMGSEFDTQKDKRLHFTVPLNLIEMNESSQAANPEEHPILKLQRTVGNQAVQRLLKARRDAHNEPVKPVEPDMQGQIEEQKDTGEQLPAELQSEMEQELGSDLSDVRLHTDSTSAELAKSLGARAFTQGRDIFFARGAYDENSLRGHETLTHELTHVVEGRTTSGGVQRDDDPNIEMDPPETAQQEIEMAPVYMRPWGSNDVNPYYAAAQSYLSRYFEFQRGLAQLLAKMRDYGYTNFQTASSTEYNKKEDSFLLRLFEFALTVIPAAGGLLATFKVLTGGPILGEVGAIAKGASEAGGAVSTAEKAGESVSAGEKVLKTTEGVKGVTETAKKAKELGGGEPEAKARGDFSMEIIHSLAELEAQRWTAAWADELRISEILESHRNANPTVDLETNTKAVLETLYGPMVIPGDDVIVRASEIFELQLYQAYWVEERGVYHKIISEEYYDRGDKGIKGMPEGVIKRIDKLNGWDIVKIPVRYEVGRDWLVGGNRNI